MFAALKRRSVEIETKKYLKKGVHWDLKDSVKLLIDAMNKAAKKGAQLKKEFDSKKGTPWDLKDSVKLLIDAMNTAAKKGAQLKKEFDSMKEAVKEEFKDAVNIDVEQLSAYLPSAD